MELKKSLLWAIVFSAASTVAVAGGDKSSKSDAASDDAASASSQPMTSFSEVDKDGNGMLDKNEAAAAEGLDFLYTDLNQDGSVSSAEYEVVVRQQEDIADGATGDSGELKAIEDEAETGAAESGEGDTADPEADASTDADAPADEGADVEAESQDAEEAPAESQDAEEAPTETESSQ
jgi:hypothetical protein